MLFIGVRLGLNQVSRLNGNVFDSFNRADNAASLGSAETGQAWTATVGTWGVLGGAAKLYGTSGGIGRAIIDAPKPNCVVSVQFTTAVLNQRLIFRYTDGSNEWYLGVGASGTYILAKRVAGVVTTMGTSAIPVANGDFIALNLNGSSINAYVNGALLFTITDSFNSSAIKHGMYVQVDTTATFKYFTVEAMS